MSFASPTTDPSRPARRVWRNRPRSIWRNRHGATALEYAMVFPAFAFLLLGTIELGRYFITVQMVNTVAAEAARVALIDYDKKNASGQSYVSSTIEDVMRARAPFLSATDLNISVTRTDYATALAEGHADYAKRGMSDINVTATYPFTTVMRVIFFGRNFNFLNQTITSTTTYRFNSKDADQTG